MRHPKQFSLETLPSAPSWETVNVLVKHYGTSDAGGKRNTAIIAIYGMRSSEVANLKLKDIDWDKELIYLHRAKRGGLQSFPLMAEVGNLIADYLRNGRNNELCRENLFLTLCMPYKNISKDCIYNIVSKAYRSLDVSVKHKGGHFLRHACASHLINNGSSLKVYSMVQRREIKGEKVPSDEKIFSIYELHTDIIVKGSREVQFGHKINLSTGRINLILSCEVLEGNPADSSLYKKTLDRVIGNYRITPRDSATDGGYASKKNLEYAQSAGIINIVFNKITGSLTCSAATGKARLIFIRKCFGAPSPTIFG